MLFELSFLYDPLTKNKLTTELRALNVTFPRSANKPIVKEMLVNHHVESTRAEYSRMYTKVIKFIEIIL